MSNHEHFENEHVHKFYKKYADDFNITRVKPWPKIIDFLNKYDRKNYLNLDCGCGNGRNLNISNLSTFIGMDFSHELLKLIKSDNVLRGDCMSLPFKDKTFNIILSIAVIHHLSTYDRRRKAMKEMFRCLKENGKILLYVWDEKTKHKSKFKHIENKEYFVKFNNNFDRYYHLFDINELIDFCKDCGFIIEECGFEQESIFAILSKKFN
ncbi:trna (uracil-5-)-methyltransferase trm9 [Vairimorpha apis BRL 01]|uniref:Trna (Uracil-5-)-methyltransferase trm9 n=1 Tax=Vairimorpha apis BRL 01 TaxID=1037528 RepID=T0MFD7_9MICR|nr:trna (uracil-5-)-methyltransferase trm9 [Vairimorpha apis BRL 01]